MDCIGTRIKQIRKKHKLTQTEFSKLICISQSHLSEVEHGYGSPSKAVVKLISILFCVDELWLSSGKLSKSEVNPLDVDNN